MEFRPSARSSPSLLYPLGPVRATCSAEQVTRTHFRILHLSRKQKNNDAKHHCLMFVDDGGFEPPTPAM